MKIGSLCSGAGGLDMAVEQVFGAETVWHCEINDAVSKVLGHRYPGMPNHRDLTATDWDAVEPIDILTGGYPCQPTSVTQPAGRPIIHSANRPTPIRTPKNPGKRCRPRPSRSSTAIPAER